MWGTKEAEKIISTFKMLTLIKESEYMVKEVNMKLYMYVYNIYQD